MASRAFLPLFNFEPFILLSRNSFIRNTYRRSSRFAVFCPKSSARKSIRRNTRRNKPRNLFIRNTYKKLGRVICPANRFDFAEHGTTDTVPRFAFPPRSANNTHCGDSAAPEVPTRGEP